MWLFYALSSAIFAAFVAILGKLGLKNIDTIFATTIRSIIMAAFLILVSLSLKKFISLSFNSMALKDWFLIIGAGIAGALSWLFYFAALKHGLASKVSAIDRLSLIFVILLAAIFLGEKLSWKSAVGALLMAGGAILITIK